MSYYMTKMSCFNLSYSWYRGCLLVVRSEVDGLSDKNLSRPIVPLGDLELFDFAQSDQI